MSCLSFTCPLSSPQPPPPAPPPPPLPPTPPPLPSPPPPPPLLHQGSCGLSERQTNEGPRRAVPALPDITLSLSQSHTHTPTHTHTHAQTEDLPAFVPCRQCLRVVMVTSSRFLPLRPDCVALRWGGAPCVGAMPCHAVPCRAMPCHAVPCDAGTTMSLQNHVRSILSLSTTLDLLQTHFPRKVSSFQRFKRYLMVSVDWFAVQKS